MSESGYNDWVMQRKGKTNMLNVTLGLRCNVCRSGRFMVPTLNEVEQDVRCAECNAFKCHSDALEKVMAQEGARPLRNGQPGRLAS